MPDSGSFMSIFLMAIGLSTDCFAVAFSGGISNRNYAPRQVRPISTSFSLFQAMMIVLGWFAGDTIVG
jgi:putative Mn2+ efflux pump MntP